jgi:hypothetical protein
MPQLAKKHSIACKENVHYKAMLEDMNLKLNLWYMWHFQAQWKDSILV